MFQNLSYDHDSFRRYSRSGIEIAGPTEMRWAMKYTDLKPRPYYARGPDQAFPSRYIQQVFNCLVDIFPISHRKRRFLTDDIRAADNQAIFIYDYSSFTSTFHEVNNFLYALSRFFADTVIEVVDTFKGLTNINLGEYLHTYVRTCNIWPEFDVSRANPDAVYLPEALVYHNTGMLGIPGNIFSCTLAHSLHLSIIIKSLIFGRCVGDDAIGVSGLPFQTVVFPLLENIGDVSLPKAEVFTVEQDDVEGSAPGATWNYIKRPIRRLGGRVVQDRMLMFPPIALLLGFDSKYHTTLPLTWEERIKRASNALKSLWVSAEPYFFPLNDEEREFLNLTARTIVMSICKKVHDSRSPEAFPSLAASHLKANLNVMLDAPLGRDFFEHWWINQDRVMMELPVPFTHVSYPDDDRSRIVPGILYNVKNHPMWRLLRRMQWVTFTEKTENVLLCWENKARFEAFFFGETRPQYTVVVHSSCPDHMLDAIHTVFVCSDTVDDYESDSEPEYEV